jgi:TIR domain
MSRITISYRREDSMDITGRIFDRLTSRYGRETVFRDIDNIPPGMDFREHIRRNIDESDVLMVVVGPRWLGGERNGHSRVHSETDYVRVEVEIALQRKIPVIPLLVGDADMPEPAELPEAIRDFAYRNAVYVDSGRDFDHHMNGLIRATDAILLNPAPAHSSVSGPTTVAGNIQHRASASEPQAKPAGRALAPPGGNLFLPVVGGVMTVVGLMETAWFMVNVLAAWSADALLQLFGQIWIYADMSFGFGGLVFGIGTIRGAQWARAGGIILCLLIASANFLWFVDSYDKEIPRFILVGTGLATFLAVVGAYLLLFRWPACPDQMS